MYYRIPALLLTALALTLFVGRAAVADEKQHGHEHEGKVVKAGDGKLTMASKDDKGKHTHAVAKTAKITLDGKTAKLEDLKAGYHIKVTMSDEKMEVIKVEAHSHSHGK